MNQVIENLVQCIGCAVFDHLFQIVSVIGAVVYQRMSELATVMIVLFWLYYAVFLFWSFLKSSDGEVFYKEKFQKPLIATIAVGVLLSLGVMIPRALSMLTFEPVAEITTVYSQMILQITPEEVTQRITYVPMPMADDGIFRPELRDSVIHLMATVVTQFQGLMMLGVAVVWNSFSFTLNPVQLLRNILMFIMGVYLLYTFFKLFIRFCFYFLDVIIELALFAFLFPFSLAAFVLNSSESAGWVKDIGKGVAGSQRFKRVVGSIVNLAATVLVYLVVMVVIAKFFQSSAMEANELVGLVLSGDLSHLDLSNENMVNMSLLTFIILGYLLDYLVRQVPEVSEEIFKAFGVDQLNEVGKKMADEVMTSAKGVVDQVSEKVGTAIKGNKGGTP